MNFKRTILTLILFQYALICSYGQINETFSGSTFNDSGLWEGTIDNFSVNSVHQGVLNASAAGSSYFLTQTSFFDSTLYTYYLNVKFASSTQNFTEFYLQLNGNNPDTADGYVFRIGEAGANDALQLFYRHNQNDSLIAKGGDGIFANAFKGFFEYRVVNKNLTVYFTSEGGSPVEVLQQELQQWTNATSYSGLGMTYTSSNVKNVSFDDISMKQIVPDNTAPYLVEARVDSLRQITLFFSELLDSDSAIDTSNYKLQQSDHSISDFESINLDDSKVTLRLFNALQENTDYTLYLQDILDKAGNRMHDTSINLRYERIVPEPLDILINEIMADPSPIVGLPDAEYLELYNRSQKNIDLSTISLKRDQLIIPLPKYELKAGDYVILTSNSTTSLLAQYGAVLGVSSFPALYNDGSELALISSEDGQIIHSVKYDVNSYHDAVKANGGWSLEYVGDNQICYSDPFSASNDLSGGTPGRINSDHGDIQKTPLVVNNFQWDGDKMISICFSQRLSMDSISASNSVKIAGLNLDLLDPGTSACFTFEIKNPVQANVLFAVNISDLEDCNGQSLALDTILYFGRFEPPKAKDLVISEILFDPDTGGKDYLEIFNRSGHIIDLSALIVGNTSNKTKYKVGQTIYAVPGTYTVLSQDKTVVENAYSVPVPEQLYQVKYLPAFNQDKGNVSLYYPDNGDTLLIDSMIYSKSMYNIFLQNTKGISIERVDLEGSSIDATNWQSAASDLRGTPTGPNSQGRRPIPDDKVDIVSTDQDHLSPDGDGYLDYLLVHYKLDAPGYSLTWKVFDLKGRLIKGNNIGSIAGVSGTITWQGEDDNNNHVLPGIYILAFEFINNTGAVKKAKLTTVVSYK